MVRNISFHVYKIIAWILKGRPHEQAKLETI